jgi:hypothetical protein
MSSFPTPTRFSFSNEKRYIAEKAQYRRNFLAKIFGDIGLPVISSMIDKTFLLKVT